MIPRWKIKPGQKDGRDIATLSMVDESGNSLQCYNVPSFPLFDGITTAYCTTDIQVLVSCAGTTDIRTGFTEVEFIPEIPDEEMGDIPI